MISWGMRVPIIIVEDNAALLQPLVSVLGASAGVQVLGVAASGRAGLALARRLRPAVALVDLNLPDIPGVEVIRELASMSPPVIAVAWTVMGDPSHVHQAVAAGASGYLFKDEAPERICGAIGAAALGGAPLSAAAARLILDRARASLATEVAGSSSLSAGITPRESEVLVLLSQGHTYADCARALNMGVGTVQCHVKSIYRKLNVASKAEAAAWAIRNGVVA